MRTLVIRESGSLVVLRTLESCLSQNPDFPPDGGTTNNDCKRAKVFRCGEPRTLAVGQFPSITGQSNAGFAGPVSIESRNHIASADSTVAEVKFDTESLVAAPGSVADLLFSHVNDSQPKAVVHTDLHQTGKVRCNFMEFGGRGHSLAIQLADHRAYSQTGCPRGGLVGDLGHDDAAVGVDRGELANG